MRGRGVGARAQTARRVATHTARRERPAVMATIVPRVDKVAIREENDEKAIEFIYIRTCSRTVAEVF